MKGITPVIAIILLLLITIAMVGFAFVWFSRVATTSGTNIESQLNTTFGASGKKVGIDSRTTTVVAVRNIGSVTLQTSEISVYVDGGLRTCTWAGAITSLAPGAVGSCTFSGAACAGPARIRVTAPGNADETACP